MSLGTAINKMDINHNSFIVVTLHFKYMFIINLRYIWTRLVLELNRISLIYFLLMLCFDSMH